MSIEEEQEIKKRIYKCPICNKKYQRPSWYKKHLKENIEKYKNKKLFIVNGGDIKIPGNLSDYFVDE